MDIKETLTSAYTSLRINKVRTFLTMLGVIIGVFAVIALISIVKGVQNNITGEFNSLGSNLVLVAPGRVSFNQDPSALYNSNKLAVKDVDLINKYAADYVVAAVPNIRVGMTVEYKTKKYFATLAATSYKAINVINLNLTKGRFFNQGEEQSSARVVLIGPQVKQSLFGASDPIGKSILIDKRSFVVIGILGKMGFNADERVMIPYTTAKNTLNINNFSGIAVKVKENVNFDQAVSQIKLALLNDLKANDFSVISSKDILNSIQSILGIISIGLAAIAAISLLVGGIGIMNIMLVSVNERIREIGLRKALGATPLNIGLQFMMEALIISVGGGLIGILLGYILALFLKSLINSEVPFWSIALAFSFSVLIGLLFGTYPAVKASKKDPIEALRYE